MDMFDQSVMAGTIFCTAVSWRGSVTERDTRRLAKVIRENRFVLGRCQDSLKVVVERWMWNKLNDIVENTNHSTAVAIWDD